MDRTCVGLEGVRGEFEQPLGNRFFWIFLATIPRVKHLFPFRTEQLSPAGPMVLYGRLYGRVGRCQELLMKARFSV